MARNAVATLSHTFLIDEDAVDSSTTVTVTVVDANGLTVASGDATAGEPGAGTYTFVLAPQPQLQVLTVTWTATISGFIVLEQDLVEIVGGFLFTLAEARESDAQLADRTKYPTSALIAARLETEIECEDICGRAFTPHYHRFTTDGTGTDELLLEKTDIRTPIRAVRVAPRVDEPFVALTEAQLATLVVTPDNMLRRTDYVWWTEGQSNVIAEYDYGLDGPPKPLKEAALVRFRSLITKHRSGIPDRAQSFTAVDGGTYRLSMPGRFATGIPDVDAVYARYAVGAGAGGLNGSAGQPASRSLNFDPQYLSMFHGGVR